MNIAELWIVSIDSGISGMTSNYDVVRDRCFELQMNTFEVYRLCRTMTSELNKKDR